MKWGFIHIFLVLLWMREKFSLKNAFTYTTQNLTAHVTHNFFNLRERIACEICHKRMGKLQILIILDIDDIRNKAIRTKTIEMRKNQTNSQKGIQKNNRFSCATSCFAKLCLATVIIHGFSNQIHSIRASHGVKRGWKRWSQNGIWIL